MPDLEFRLRLSADGSGYIGNVRLAREETEKLGQAGRQASSGTAALDAAMKTSTASAVALGAALGFVAVQAATAFTRWSVDGVHAAAALKDLHDVTGSTVEDLSRLTNIAKVSGTSAAEFGDIIGRLAVRLAGTDEESTKAGKALAALGIQARDPARAMQELAQKFAGYTDDINKAAYANAIFGKGGEKLLPLLKDIVEQQGIAATVTTRQAVEAERLEKNLRLLTIQAGDLRDALLGGLVPAISDLIEQMRGGIAIAGGFWNALNLFSTLPVVSNIADVQAAIAEVNANLADSEKKYATAVGRWTNEVLGNSLEKTRADAAAKIKFLQLQAEQLLRTANAADTEFGDLAGAMARAANAKGTLGAPPGGAGGGKAAKQQVADYRDEIQKLNDAMNKVAGTDGGYSHLIAANEKYQKDLRDGKQINIEQARVMMQTAVAADEQAVQVKDLGEAWKVAQKQVADMAEYESRAQDAISATTASIEALVQGLDQETRTMFLTNDERERAIALSKLQAQYDEGLIPTQEALAEAVAKVGEAYDRRNGAAALKKSLEEQEASYRQAYDSISNGITDSLLNAWSAGKNGAKALIADLKNMFANLVLRPIIQAAVAPLAGSLTGLLSGGAQAAGGAPGGGLLGSLGNLGSLGGASSLFGASGFTAGLAGDAFMPAALAGGLEGAGIGAMGAAGGALMAVAPYAAIAAIAIPMIIKAFKKSPKEGGFAESGVDVDRFYGKSQFDDSLSGAVEANAQQLNALLVAFGGAANAGFAQGFQGRKGKGKEGTTAAYIGGEEVYRSAGVALGKSEAEIQAALQLEAQRAVLGALQASQLPKYLGDLFNSVSASSATKEQIDNIIAIAGALKQAVDNLPQLGDALTQLDAASIAALGEAFGGLDKLASGLSFVSANFVTAADQTAKAQQQLVDDFAQLGVSMPATHQQFLDLLSSFDLTTDAGRDLYASVMGLSGAFVEVNGTATQAMESLRSSIAGLEQARASYLGTPQSTVVQNQVNSLVGQFAANRAWAQQIVDASGVTGLVQTLSQIVQSDFANYSAADQALITQILGTAATLREQGGAYGAPTPYGSSPPGYTPYVPPGEAAAALDPKQVAEEMMQKFGALAGQSTGDYGEKLGLQIRLVEGAMEDMVNNPAMAGVRSILYNNNLALNSSLKLFGELSKRYTTQVSEELVKLTESHNKQIQEWQGNSTALDILNVTFEQQWNAIINGTAAGVDGTLDELRRLQQGILDYVDGLKIGDLSPLTPAEKLAEARRQYESTLTLAQGGDRGALGDVTGAADAYLKLSREFFASSSAYTDIFGTITSQLTALGTKDFALGATPLPLNAADQALLDVLPVGKKLMSADDMLAVVTAFGGVVPGPSTGPAGGANVATSKDVKDMASAIVDAIYEAAMLAAKSGADDAGKVADSVERSKAALVDALTVGRHDR